MMPIIMEDPPNPITTTTTSTTVTTVDAIQTNSVNGNTKEGLLLLDVGLETLRKSNDQASSGSSRRRRSDNNCCNAFFTTATQLNHDTSTNNRAIPPRIADLNTGIMDERVLALVFRSINWDPHAVSRTACVCRRIRAVARRVLWRDLCYARAPRMVSTLLTPTSPPPHLTSSSSSSSTVAGGWPALAKLFFYCCGCSSSTRHLHLPYPSSGHFTTASRFSKTSGKSFLSRNCRGDLLYVSDPCEHPMASTVTAADPAPSSSYDVGVYRGVFRSFIRSRTRAVLVQKRAELDARIRCPYCGARVWNMTAAKMVPKSAARRLGSHPGCLDYFVCVHGHLHGNCLLAHLSSSEEDEDIYEDDDDDEDGQEDY